MLCDWNWSTFGRWIVVKRFYASIIGWEYTIRIVSRLWLRRLDESFLATNLKKVANLVLSCLVQRVLKWNFQIKRLFQLVILVAWSYSSDSESFDDSEEFLDVAWMYFSGTCLPGPLSNRSLIFRSPQNLRRRPGFKIRKQHCAIGQNFRKPRGEGMGSKGHRRLHENLGGIRWFGQLADGRAG